MHAVRELKKSLHRPQQQRKTSLYNLPLLDSSQGSVCEYQKKNVKQGEDAQAGELSGKMSSNRFANGDDGPG